LKKQQNQQLAGGNDDHSWKRSNSKSALMTVVETVVGIAVETTVAFDDGASAARHYSNGNNEQNVIKATINCSCKNSHGFGASEACSVSNCNSKQQQSTGGNGD